MVGTAVLGPGEEYASRKERRRLTESLLLSLVVWAIIIPLIGFWKFASPGMAEASMNPMYVELAPPTRTEQVPVAEKDAEKPEEAPETPAKEDPLPEKKAEIPNLEQKREGFTGAARSAARSAEAPAELTPQEAGATEMANAETVPTDSSSTMMAAKTAVSEETTAPRTAMEPVQALSPVEVPQELPSWVLNPDEGQAAAVPKATITTLPPQAEEAPVRSALSSSAASTSTPALRPDPSKPLPAPSRKTAQATEETRDPFAPLSEEALKTSQPPTSVQAAAPKTPPTSLDAERAQTTAPKLEETRQAKALTEMEKALETPPSKETTTARATSTRPVSTGKTGAGGSGGSDVVGGIDFGGTGNRTLLSPRRIKIPDKLTADLPQDITTTVSFTVEPGGTVLPGTVRFDPPLMGDLEAFLRTAFSAWYFTPGDSDGQAVFRYSIKVR